MNPHQIAVTKSKHKQIVVAAGAGAGKTHTLIERIRELIVTDQACACDITCITFTNAAADELTERLQTKKVPCCKKDYNGDGNCAIHPDGIKLAYCGTLHGWLVKILRQYGNLIGLPKDMAIIDEVTSKEILEDTMQELSYSGTKKALAEELTSITGLLEPSRMMSPARQAACGYHLKLIQNGLLDFNSILAYGLFLLNTKQTVVKMATPFGFVDEFQDTSIMHQKVYNAAKFTDLCVIGDSDQSIYGFLKADPQGFNRLAYSAASELHILDINYRSDRAITRAANSMIGLNTNRVAKFLKSNSELQGSVEVVYPDDETAQKNQLLNAISKLNSDGNGLSCAVLVRTNWQVQDIADYLRSNGVPVRERIQRDEPMDWGTVRRIIAFLCKPSNNLLAYQMLKHTHSPLEASEMKSKATIGRKPINDMFLHVEHEMPVDKVPEFLARAVVTEESIARVTEKIELLKDRTLLGLSLALGEYAEPQDTDSDAANRVVISTIHAAKGKEYDAVFLPSWCQEMFPAKAKEEKFEEQRRLAFVAVTRARHNVWISAPRSHRKHAKAHEPEPMTPSQFISEMCL